MLAAHKPITRVCEPKLTLDQSNTIWFNKDLSYDLCWINKPKMDFSGVSLHSFNNKKIKAIQNLPQKHYYTKHVGTQVR